MSTFGPMSAVRTKPPPLIMSEARQTRQNVYDEADATQSERKELRNSLEAGWAAARVRFLELTKMDLNEFVDGKVGVVKELRRSMVASGLDIDRHQAHMATVEKVLNCVEFVGSVAAQGVSLVFSQASLCFSAIQMLINVPKTYKTVIDGLQELFSNINEFFPKLKIFQRTDYNLGLDSALVNKLNEILIALVDTCAAAIKISKHKLIAVTKIIFLGDNKIQDAISGFKSKIAQLDSLTAPVTLEKILETRNISLDSNRRLISIEATGRETSENVKEVRIDVKEMSTGVKELLYLNAEGRNLKADQEKIEKIDKALFVTKEAVTESLRTLESCHENMLEGTVKVLGQQECFNPDRSPHQPEPILLEGKRGTGRTYYLAGLVKAVSLRISPIFIGDCKPIWAYYSFGDKNLSEGGKRSPSFRKALSLMACQIARQSSAYTRLLQKDIDNMNQAKDTKEFLAKLKFRELLEQDNYTLYLIFDGLDHLKGDLTGLDEVLELTKHSVATRTWPQIILAAEDDTLKNVTLPNHSTIHTKVMNSTLLRDFVEEKVTILQDDSEKAHRKKLVDKLIGLADNRFDVAQQKLDVVDKAVADDLDLKELLRRLSDDDVSEVTSQADEMLDDVFRDLNANLRGQLKEILYWCSFGESRVKTDLLTSSLYLGWRKKPLGTLEAKIRRTFGDVLGVDNAKYVTIINGVIEEHLHWLPRSAIAIEMAKNRKEGTLTSRQDVGESVQKLLNAVGESISSGDFSSLQKLQIGEMELYKHPVLTSVEAHWTIACRCLQALNDDKHRKEMQSLVNYATDELPEHLYSLDGYLHLLTIQQQRALGRELVKFLSNAERIEAIMVTTSFQPYAWFTSRMNVRAIGNILKNGKLKYELNADLRETANRLVSRDTPSCLPFLETFATAAANLLFDETKQAESSAYNLFNIIRRYLDLVTDKFRTLDFTSQIGSPISTRRSSPVSSRSSSPVSSRRSSSVSTRRSSPVSTRRSSRVSRRSSTSSKASKREEVSIVGESASVPFGTAELQGNKDGVIANGHTGNEDGVERTKIPNHEEQSTIDPGTGQRLETADSQGVMKPKSTSNEGLPPTATVSNGHVDDVVAQSSVAMTDLIREASPARSRSQSSVRTASVILSQTDDENFTQVKDWALQKIGITENWFTWLRLGQAVGRRNEELEQAYYKKAFESSETATVFAKCKTARALAACYADNEKWSDALSTLSSAADALRQHMKSAESSEELRTTFNEILEQLVEYMLEAKKDNEAIEILKEGLERTPTNGYYSYYLIQLLCKTKQMEAAQSIFDAWKSESGQTDQNPGFYVTKVLQRQSSGAILGLVGIFLSARGWPLLEYFEQSISDVVSDSQQDRQNDDKFLLHFARGLAWSVTRDESAMINAAESWYKAMDLLPRTKLEDTYVSAYCQRYLAQIEFDHAQLQIRVQKPSRTHTKETFANVAGRIQRIFIDGTFYDAQKCRSFAIAALMFAGKSSAARALVKSDVAYAIELLTDEDDDNDIIGMWQLCRTMLLVREYEACHNAYSYFGRPAEETKSSSSPVLVAKAGVEPESTPGSDAQKTDADDHPKTEADPSPEEEVFSLANDYTVCCGCDTRLYAKGDTETWMCKYCHDEGFCTSCYKKLKEDKLEKYVCHPDHDHLLLKHFDYEDEEIKGDNVRVGWKYEQGKDPSDRHRVGKGDIVDRKTWMDMLRKEWDIEAPAPKKLPTDEESAEMEYMMFGGRT